MKMTTKIVDASPKKSLIEFAIIATGILTSPSVVKRK